MNLPKCKTCGLLLDDGLITATIIRIHFDNSLICKFNSNPKESMDFAVKECMAAVAVGFPVKDLML